MHKVGHNKGHSRCENTLIFLQNFQQLLIPLIYKIVFKNASPLGYMIVLIYQKQGSQGVKTGFTPPKNEVAPGKNEVHI